ncbi:MAG: pyrroloquinoline quinone-dependent dehydrogenase [Gemmatimonadota bacterium]|nr:pyrroloquinoline quinone-dependent dehydrogenase [Gemmatimonadota bacterium]
MRNLRVAWTYTTGAQSPEAKGQSQSGRPPRFEATPILIDGRLYLSTPLGRVIALNAATGTEIWSYDARIDEGGDYGDFANRGVSTWLDSKSPANSACRRRIFIATIDARLIALDARDGKPCAGFGHAGIVDLTAGLRNAPEYKGEYFETSPPAAIGGLVIVGSGVADNNRIDAPSGAIRAFDARSGSVVWSWDPVPQDSTDPAWRTWVGPRAHRTGAANAWSVITVDTARGLVFAPTGSASTDYYGGERLGDNRYANSVVALHALTGKLVWSFQLVHHDLWDYDVAAPPTVATIRRGASAIRAVIQTGKTAQLYVLDEETGAPLFPVTERAVPRSSVPGEQSSATQPFSALPSLSPIVLNRDSIVGVTEAERASCRRLMAPLRYEGAYTPPSPEGSLVIPSNVGGPQWGGVTYDRLRNLVIVPVNRFAAAVQLIPREKYDSTANEKDWEYTGMTGTPYIMRRRRLESARGYACAPTPWAALVAIDLNSGMKKWEVPLGDPSSLMAEDFPGSVPKDAKDWGTSVMGGAITTTTGLVFISGTSDRMLRAFDTETGAELWRAELPARAKATPMTYTLSSAGKQYIVIAVGGDTMAGRGASVIAFALP